MAEREGFEPSIRYKRIHTFQACSFSHSDTSPESITSLSAKHMFIPSDRDEAGGRIKNGSGLSVQCVLHVNRIRQYPVIRGPSSPWSKG